METRQYLTFLLLLLACATIHGFPGRQVVLKTKGYAWPKPQHQNFTAKYLALNSPSIFKFRATGYTCNLLESAFVRYAELIFHPPRLSSKYRNRTRLALETSANFQGYLDSVEVHLNSACEGWPYLNMDEQYSIKIDTDDQPMKAQITSTTTWGALRGLETFSQLVYRDGHGYLVVNSTFIFDFPKFSHRGLLLDTSRHFISKKKLFLNLDAMAYNKLNVFHWHIVDDTSFPYQSGTFPELSNKGAYNPVTHVYTLEDVVQVIEYARKRGIRVVPEFDSPGHTDSWGAGHPDLLTPCYKNVNGTFVQNGVGPINPILDSSYAFLESFFFEISRVFPDRFIHLGGDEVPFDCWESNPNVTDFMKRMDFKNTKKLEEFYVNNVLNIIQRLPGNKSYIIWQEVVDNNVTVKEDTVVEVWKGGWQQEMAEVTNIGLRTILASCWYLNDVKGVSDWKELYACDPLNFTGSDKQKKLVMGGEVCLWGEFVDGTNSIPRLWPRASAPAERLWSDPSVMNMTEAAPRLEEHRCRMLARGINAEPQEGPGFCDVDYLV